MAILFPRVWRVSVGSLDLSELDTSFRVERKTRGSLNVAEIRLTNPAPSTIAEARAGAQIRLHAGFRDAMPMLFSGTIRRARVERSGAERILTIVGRDGGSRFAESTIFSRAYAPGVRVSTVVADIVESLGVGRGNLGDFAWTSRSGGDTLPQGYAYHGRAVRALGDLAAGAGLRWSVQHGAIQVMRRGQALSARGDVLTPDSGLLDVPVWDERGRTLSARALIRPGLEPGARVRIESAVVAGGRADFEIRSAVWEGDTQSDAWHAALTLRPL